MSARITDPYATVCMLLCLSSMFLNVCHCSLSLSLSLSCLLGEVDRLAYSQNRTKDDSHKHRMLSESGLNEVVQKGRLFTEAIL